MWPGREQGCVLMARAASRSRAAATLCALLFALALCAWTAPPADAYVYWSHFNRLGRANLDTSALKTNFILGAGSNLQGVAVDSSHIYWGSASGGTIGRANLDGTGVNPSFITGASNVQGVAVDAGHIYWSNFGFHTIGRANLDGTGVNQNFIDTTVSDAAFGVAVDAGHIYWANEGLADGIARANLDGTGVNQTFITGLNAPYGMAVDAGHVYWTDSTDNVVGRANLDGTGVSKSFITGAATPVGVAVNATHVYWVNNQNSTIGRANLDGSGVNQSYLTLPFITTFVALDARSSTAPAVTTDAASDVTSTGASLNATIDPNGETSTYKFEYGTTTAFGTVVPAAGTFSTGFGFDPEAQAPRAVTGLAPATTYYYRACANNVITGAGSANQVCGAVRSFTTSGGPTAPSATTDAASSITATTAQVNGTVIAHGAATAYVFEYGTTTAFGQIAPLPSGNAGSGTASLPVTASVSGLAPNTTYSYRLVATNSQGTTLGPVMRFGTGPSLAPAVSTGAASDITPASATLNATVNPRGQVTSFTFEYGTTLSFGQISAIDSTGDGLPTTRPVSLPVSGLTPATTYLYRIVATNATGSTTGPVMSFATLPIS
jgi:phosphodiesterase/alkaline phosphatase D-like protein/streptogramin lyase